MLSAEIRAGNRTPATPAPSAATDRLDEDELADWRSGRDAIYQLAALTVGARLAWRTDTRACQEKTPAGEPGFQGIAIEQGDLRSIADT